MENRKSGKLHHGAEWELSKKGSEVTIIGKCVFSGENFGCVVPAEEFFKWLDGEVIQKAMPLVSEANREFIISGVSPAGWELLGEEDLPEC